MLKLRTKTVVKLESETVRYDIEFAKGAPVSSFIRSLFNVIHDVTELTQIRDRLDKLIDNANKRDAAELAAVGEVKS